MLCGLEARLADLLGDIEADSGLRLHAETLTGRFCRLLKELHRRSGWRAVALRDEHDKPILDVLGAPEKLPGVLGLGLGLGFFCVGWGPAVCAGSGDPLMSWIYCLVMWGVLVCFI